MVLIRGLERTAVCKATDGRREVSVDIKKAWIILLRNIKAKNIYKLIMTSKNFHRVYKLFQVSFCLYLQFTKYVNTASSIEIFNL